MVKLFCNKGEMTKVLIAKKDPVLLPEKNRISGTMFLNIIIA